MTLTTIALVCFLKGVLVAVLVKFGRFKTHEQRREERQVLLAYRVWRRSRGSENTAVTRITAEDVSKLHG